MTQLSDYCLKWNPKFSWKNENYSPKNENSQLIGASCQLRIYYYFVFEFSAKLLLLPGRAVEGGPGGHGPPNIYAPPRNSGRNQKDSRILGGKKPHMQKNSRIFREKKPRLGKIFLAPLISKSYLPP